MTQTTSRARRRPGLAATLVLSAAALSACSVTNETFVDSPPQLAVVSRPNDALRRLPAPADKTVVAVYEYNDLTGQYRERENVQTLSRAVTQGGAPVLVKALQDAGEGRWFTVLERAELDNLLRERQILTEMRRIYRNENNIDASVLPPLMHASIIVEGGIIGFDTNTITGGVGARYLGIGADTRYTQDTVTVTLRAVSTKTGEVLSTVTARKAVASYALQGGAFRFLRLDELLEAEAGVTYNEPKQIAVESAIEAAVQSLIIEGAAIGVWDFADKAAGQEYIAEYRERKYQDNLTVAAQTPPPVATADPTAITPTVARAPQPVRVTTLRQPSPSPRASAPPRSSGASRETAPRRQPPQQQEQPARSVPDDLPPAPGEPEEILGGRPAEGEGTETAVGSDNSDAPDAASTIAAGGETAAVTSPDRDPDEIIGKHAAAPLTAESSLLEPASPDLFPAETPPTESSSELAGVRSQAWLLASREQQALLADTGQ